MEVPTIVHEGGPSRWDSQLQQADVAFDPGQLDPSDERYVRPLIHDGTPLEDALSHSAAEIKSDLLWGNLALPIDESLAKLRLLDGAVDPAEALAMRRDVRAMLQLSMQQLEEMVTKGHFNNEYRAVVAAWHMMQLPETSLRSPLLSPQDAQRAATRWLEADLARRSAEGARWRASKEAAAAFDRERAAAEPYAFEQSGTHELTLTVPVPARTRPRDVRVTIKAESLHVTVAGHPAHPLVDGKLEHAVDPSGSTWHLEGEFESRALVIQLEKAVARPWAALLVRGGAPPAAEGARAPAAPSAVIDGGTRRP